MTQLERMEALLDDMGVWYEREDNHDTNTVSLRVHARVLGYKNGGSTEAETEMVFSEYGSLISFNPWNG